MSLGDPGRAQLWFDEAAKLYPDGALRRFECDPTLTSISAEPEFIAMLAEVKADVAAQLEEVRAMSIFSASSPYSP